MRNTDKTVEDMMNMTIKEVKDLCASKAHCMDCEYETACYLVFQGTVPEYLNTIATEENESEVNE